MYNHLLRDIAVFNKKKYFYVPIAGQIRNNTNKRNWKYHTKNVRLLVYSFVFLLSFLFLLLLGKLYYCHTHTHTTCILVHCFKCTQWLTCLCVVYTFNKYTLSLFLFLSIHMAVSFSHFDMLTIFTFVSMGKSFPSQLCSHFFNAHSSWCYYMKSMHQAILRNEKRPWQLPSYFQLKNSIYIVVIW